jgi:4-hydroxybenzoate polyprenyltransferase
MRGLVTYFVFGSWWVALCASCMGLLTWLELTGSYWNAPLFFFILGSTLVVYNLNMLSGLTELRKIGTDSERHHWCMANERLMKITLVIGLFIAAASVWLLNPVIWLLMAPLTFVSIAYTAPILRINAAATRIREIGLWKIFLIAAVWTGMTVILPAVEHYGFNQITDLFSWRLSLGRTLFILAITIPFDVRDLINDAKKGVRTIPSTLGWKRSVFLAEFLLLAFISLIYLRLGIHHPFFIGYLISTIITMLIVAFSNPQRSDMYCSFWVEGTMMLQFLTILLII